MLEDPWNEPPKDMFLLTRDPMDAPNEPEYLEIGFENGNPVSINGQAYGPAMLLGRMNEIAGRHGVGRVDLCESRYVGMKSRGVYETPGGTVLHRAHRAMESITLDREQIRVRDSLIPEYSTLVYRGFWFAPERIMLQGMFDSIQEVVTGTVRLKLYKGNVTVVGRKSPYTLYREDFVTFERDDVYDQRDATGFIRLTGLRLRLDALRDRAKRLVPAAACAQAVVVIVSGVDLDARVTPPVGFARVESADEGAGRIIDPFVEIAGHVPDGVALPSAGAAQQRAGRAQHRAAGVLDQVQSGVAPVERGLAVQDDTGVDGRRQVAAGGVEVFAVGLSSPAFGAAGHQPLALLAEVLARALAGATRRFEIEVGVRDAPRLAHRLRFDARLELPPGKIGQRNRPRRRASGAMARRSHSRRSRYAKAGLG